MMTNRNDKGSFAEAATNFAQGVARICQLYGVNPLFGRLFAILFLAPEPLSLDELCARAGAAKSTVSVALRQLQSMHVARRHPPGSDRRDYYEAVTDPWAIISDWARFYFEPEIEMWRETGAALNAALRSGKDAPRGRDNAELRARLARVQEFMTVIEAVIGQVARAGAPPAKAKSIRIHVDGDEP